MSTTQHQCVYLPEKNRIDVEPSKRLYVVCFGLLMKEMIEYFIGVTNSRPNFGNSDSIFWFHFFIAAICFIAA